MTQEKCQNTHVADAKSPCGVTSRLVFCYLVVRSGGFEWKLAISVLVGVLVKEKIGGTFESSDRTASSRSTAFEWVRKQVGTKLHTLGYRIVPAQGLLFFEKMVHRFCLIRYAWLNFFEVSGSTYGKICAHELFNIGHPIQSLHSWWLFIIPFASSKPQTRLEGAVWVRLGSSSRSN